MSGTEPKSAAPATRRWVKVLLFTSLALNLVVIGLIAGALLRGGPPGVRDGGFRDGAAPYLRAFSDQERRSLGRQLRAAGGERETRRAEIMQGYQASLEALRADPFDEEALRSALSRQAAQAEQRRQAAQSVMIAFIAQMDPDRRLAFANRLEERMQRFGNGMKP